ncbi:Transposase, partial [Neochlamydia sp. TUME1]
MKSDKIKKLDDERFRRLTGVKRGTFDKMVQILQQADAAKKIKGGRKYKLRLEDMLLMTLEYMREYRTYF